MALLPKVKLKTLVNFPARVNGGTGIDVIKKHGTYTIDLDYSDFGSVSAIPISPTSYVLTYDSFTNAYVMVPSHLLGGGNAGIADAPVDGLLYGRNSAAWQVVPTAAAPATALPLMDGAAAVGASLLYARQDHSHPTDTSRAPEAPVDGTLYGRKNAAWVAVPGGIPDAPSDSTLYGRRNAAWVAVTGGGGFPDAPVDGSSYARLNAAWARVLPLAGGTLTGDLTISKSTPVISLNRTDANPAGIVGLKGALNRWSMQFGTGDTESGANAGSNFSLFRFNDAGGVLGTALSINRATGTANFDGSIITGGDVWSARNPTQGVYFFGGSGTKYLLHDGVGYSFLGGSNFALADQPWVSYEVPAAANGVWLGNSTPNITYHSVAGDAVNHYFTQQFLQFTSVGGPTTQEAALTINFTNQTGHSSSGVDNNNGKSGLLISGQANSGGAQMWLQANDLIINSGWSNGSPFGACYNTEIDTTNSSGFDSVPYAATPDICSLVIGGFIGTNTLSSLIKVYPGPNGTKYGARFGLAFFGDYSVQERTFVDVTKSNTSINIGNAHAIGLDLSPPSPLPASSYSFAQVRGNGFNIDTGGTYHGPSDVRLKNLDHELTGALDALERLHAWHFRWKADDSPGIGLLAHEVQEVFPELVNDKSGTLALNYTGLIAPLIVAVRELREEINQLKRTMH